MILAQAEKSATSLTLSVARRIEQEFRAAGEVPKALAAVLETSNPDKETLLRLIRRMVRESREVYGSTAAFEPYAFDPKLRWFAPYYYKGKDEIEYEQLGSESYDYFTKDWYHLPKVLRAPVWTEPYFDEGGGGVVMTTCARPFFEQGKDRGFKVRGVVTADVSLQWLTDLVSTVHGGRTGYCFIISDTAAFVTHPNPKLIMSESMFSLAEERHAKVLRTAGLDMIRKKSGFMNIGSTLTGDESYLAYARIPSPGWSLGVVFPKNELLAQMNSLHRRTGLLAAGGLILLLAVSGLVARSIARPLRSMAAATERVARGDLEIDLSDIHSEDEVGQLARSFTAMTGDLKKYIKDLTETTAAKQRIESELSIAARIQRSMLPTVFPAFPDRDEFDIYAMMRPAKEVGGDFYDFFFLDDDHLCAVIGDVSGKGVPAALFMSVTKYLIEAALGMGEAPDRALARVNRHLADNNESCMFVTIFMGILNVKTGDFLYANAGHNPPLLWDRDREPSFLEPPGGPVVGIMDDAVFGMDRLSFKPGTVLLAYTDGVTEAFSADGIAFSDKRLVLAATPVREKCVKEITDDLVKVIDSFCVGAPQADDITILALRWERRDLE